MSQRLVIEVTDGNQGHENVDQFLSRDGLV